MTQRCRFCANLSIAHLVKLAETEYTGRYFPNEAYYRHHDSFDDLDRSASAGCDLCRLIVDCFKGVPKGEEWPTIWNGPENDVDTSMYAAAKRLEESDVKIAIDSSHTYANDALRDVKVLDALTVQVGRNYELDAAHGLDNFKHISDGYVPLLRLSLIACAPRDETTHIGGFQIGRFKLEPDLGSAASHEMARGWLEDCRWTHEGCGFDELPELPTRVIDVGIGPAPERARIVHSHGRKGDYAALSHCWGGRIEVILTSKTIAQFQEALPFETLPANFRDAIVISRQLGIRYLWIDSLCILQDSAEDWEVESTKMSQVYGSATLTIAAVAASGSNVGLLTLRAPPLPCPPPIRLPVLLGGTEEVEVRRELSEEESLSRLYDYAPLSQRGWTLQESVLSARILFYGAEQIYWKCPTTQISVDGLCYGFKAPDDWQSFPKISRALYARRLPSSQHSSALPTMATSEELLVEYYSLVEAYSRRKLSFGSDKLPAFSGLARFLSSILGDYAAGLWLADIRRGLLWFAEMHFCRHVKPNCSPSWSWATTDDPVIFYDQGTLPLEKTDGSIPGAVLRILDCRVVPLLPQGSSGPNGVGDPFGRVASGSLEVEGLTLPLVRSTQITTARRSDGHAWFDNPLRHDTDELGGFQVVFRIEQEGSVYMVSVHHEFGEDGDFELDREAYMQEGYYALLVHANTDPAGMDSDAGRAKCLIIRKVPDSDAFERVGMTVLWEMSPEKLACWKSRVLVLV